jgi:putative ABC transport system permease protein
VNLFHAYRHLECELHRIYDSYVVSQRSREIGIRLALCAEPRRLKQMLVRHGLVLAAIGVAAGLAAASALTR